MGSTIKPGTYKARITKERVLVGPPNSQQVLGITMWVLRVRKYYPDGTSRVLVNHPFTEWETAIQSGIAWVQHYRILFAQRTA